MKCIYNILKRAHMTLTRELLNDSIIYSAMVTTETWNLHDKDTITFTGDLHGLLKTKKDHTSPILHPMVVNANGLRNSVDYRDSNAIEIIDSVNGVNKEDFLKFIKTNYK